VSSDLGAPAYPRPPRRVRGAVQVALSEVRSGCQRVRGTLPIVRCCCPSIICV